LYKPLPGRFKDYIASPKPNGYQSLHTAVFDGQGGAVEIQIRTESMHKDAEYGIYSHLGYKESGGSNLQKQNSKTAWTKELLEAQRNLENPNDFLKHLKLDFFEARVFAYTPKGDVIELPLGASAIDFAYAIHSDVGTRMFGAKINGKMVSIDTEISQGDIVEILCKDSCKPTRKWLGMCKTTLARTHIRKFLREHGSVIDKMLLS
jgi:GTP pyrophosphokinase